MPRGSAGAYDSGCCRSRDKWREPMGWEGQTFVRGRGRSLNPSTNRNRKGRPPRRVVGPVDLGKGCRLRWEAASLGGEG